VLPQNKPTAVNNSEKVLNKKCKSLLFGEQAFVLAAFLLKNGITN
jgi:hypothetical protein